MKLVSICTSPRSGSETFCTGLRAGGLRQAAEVGHPHYVAQLGAAYGMDFSGWPVAKILRHFAERHPVDDHVALKLFSETADAVSYVNGPEGPEGMLIHLERRDLAAQVVSVVAMWVSGNAVDFAHQVLPYELKPLHRKTVQIAIAYLRKSRRAWRRAMAPLGVPTLLTEDVLADPLGSMTALAKDLDAVDITFDPTAAAEAIAATARYQQDAQLKARICDEYADLLAPLRQKAA
jgi:LPS sulfotransferase NodH